MKFDQQIDNREAIGNNIKCDGTNIGGRSNRQTKTNINGMTNALTNRKGEPQKIVLQEEQKIRKQKTKEPWALGEKMRNRKATT